MKIVCVEVNDIDDAQIEFGNDERLRKAKYRASTMETLTNEVITIQLLGYSDYSIERINIFEHFGLGSHERLLELEFSSQLIDSKHIVPMGLGNFHLIYLMSYQAHMRIIVKNLYVKLITMPRWQGYPIILTLVMTKHISS